MGRCLLKGTDWPYGSLGRCRPKCTFTVEQVKWRLKVFLEEDKIFPFRRREICLWWLRQKKHCVEGKEDPNKAQLQQLAPGNWDSHTLVFNLFLQTHKLNLPMSSNLFKVTGSRVGEKFLRASSSPTYIDRFNQSFLSSFGVHSYCCCCCCIIIHDLPWLHLIALVSNPDSLQVLQMIDFLLEVLLSSSIRV